jgi:hypothetical protein
MRAIPLACAAISAREQSIKRVAMAALSTRAVVAGHKRDGDADSPDDIGKTRRYIEDFTTAAGKARSFTGLYQAMIALYPNRVNRAVLWSSAKSFMS